MTTFQIAFALNQLTTYLFGLVMGWLLWGAQTGLNAPLPGYEGARVLRTTDKPERVLSPSQTVAFGRHHR